MDALNTVVLARRMQAGLPFTRIFYRVTWRVHKGIGRRIRSGRQREDFLGIYGPFSLLGLMACWGVSLVLAFAVLQWAAGLTVAGAPHSFLYCLYVSSASIVTLMPNEPANHLSRVLCVAEAGVGISLMGLVVGYLPVLYQSFSSRELHTSMLDARAGSPPSAGMLLARQGRHEEKVNGDLENWEEWAAEILEGHLSYPMLAYFRSQHPNQSWLSALTTILDVSALVMVCSTGDLHRQATLTFAMGRHAVVDLARIFGSAPQQEAQPRLSREDAERLRSGVRREHPAFDIDRFRLDELQKLMAMYEPYVNTLSRYFLVALPGWLPLEDNPENWRITDWDEPEKMFTVSDPFRR